MDKEYEALRDELVEKHAKQGLLDIKHVLAMAILDAYWKGYDKGYAKATDKLLEEK